MRKLLSIAFLIQCSVIASSFAEELEFCERHFLMAPVVSPQSEEQVLKDMKQRSVNDGFIRYFGIDHFKRLMLENSDGIYRFVKKVDLASGKVQIFLVEGKVFEFEHISKHEMKIVVNSGKTYETVFLKPLSPYYLLERGSVSE